MALHLYWSFWVQVSIGMPCSVWRRFAWRQLISRYSLDWCLRTRRPLHTSNTFATPTSPGESLFFISVSLWQQLTGSHDERTRAIKARVWGCNRDKREDDDDSLFFYQLVLTKRLSLRRYISIFFLSLLVF